MENGGNKEHRPWLFDDTSETVDIYRNFVNQHMELVPFFLSAGTAAYEQGVSVMQPIAPKTYSTPDSWDYILWNDIFVAPIVVENSTVRVVKFPAGRNWVDWFDHNVVYPSGSTVNYSVPLSRFPVFKRQGAIIPLRVTDDRSLHGDSRSADALTILIDHPIEGSESKEIREYVVRPDGTGLGEGGIVVEYSFSSKTGEIKLSATAHPTQRLIILLRGVHMQNDFGAHDFVTDSLLPIHKTLGSLHSSKYGIVTDHPNNQMWIRPGDGSRGILLKVSGLMKASNLKK